MCDPADPRLAGLLDPYPAEPVVRSVLASLDDLDVDLAQLLVDRLADPRRAPTPAAAVYVHTMLATAVSTGRLDPADIRLPDRVRAVDGTVVDAHQAIIIDLPWFAGAVPNSRAVVGSLSVANALGNLLDLPLASEVIAAEIISHGVETRWESEPDLVLAAVVDGRELPTGQVVMHDELIVRLSGAVEDTVKVRLWVDKAGVTHLCRCR